MPNPAHIVFTGGATAGHLFPGLAVARELARILPAARITFAGSGTTLERELVATHGYEYFSVPCRPLPRRPWRLPRFAADNLAGYRLARRMLRKENVSIVVGLGGYASVPVSYAAKTLSLPLLLLEQNAVPGRANRWLARGADLVCAAMPECRQGFRIADRAFVVTGNPIREAFCRVSNEKGMNHNTTPPLLVILGGSRGAGELNEQVPPGLAGVAKRLVGWQVLHQAGEANVDATRARYSNSGLDVEVVSFIDSMAETLACARLVISRAGGTTLAELAAAGVATIACPFPRAADDHQRANAEVFAAAGACELIDAREHGGNIGGALSAKVSQLLEEPQKLDAMARAMRECARPLAAPTVASMIADMPVGQGRPLASFGLH
jgi:UDP-N-acetylglucosamine--N-acetylmuramyl-(pentapeptide) pyrophosphoryl-undecaprenol N-acetylglucosamine transferase